MFSKPMRELGYQLALDSIFRTKKEIYIVVGVQCLGTDRTGVSFIPYAIRNSYQEEDKQYLSDDDFIKWNEKIEIL